jgi:hypothetical protein
MNPRQRAVLVAGLVVAGTWWIAWSGFQLAGRSRMTADKVRAYVSATDLSQLSGEARARAIRGLVERLNRLTLEDRRRMRMERQWGGWFQQMTEEERVGFIEGTLPTGMKQMLTSFEQMPEPNRKLAIEDAMKRLREARGAMDGEGEAGSEPGTNAPALSEELEQRVVKLGLKTYYSESSAQTKAELAPLLEEIQRSMESGRMLRGGRRHE